MFLPFFESLRTAGIPVSLREYLSFLEGMSAGLVTYDAEGFYYLGRVVMVKDERHIDRYDRAFATIADSNITTLLVALILFGVGTGPVKGFAVTLALGILTSIFTAVVITRLIVNAVWGQRRGADLPV